MPLLQLTSFEITFVRASNAMDKMLFRCIVVLQYVSIIYQYGTSDTVFATNRVAQLTGSVSLPLINGLLLHI
jgi:hypothetical protein